MKQYLLLGVVVSLFLLGCQSAEDDPKELALKRIDEALERVTDISVPGDDFMTNVLRVSIETRLKQARDYVEAGHHADAIERLRLVERDAEDPTAVGGDQIALRCRVAIRLIRSIP